MVRFENIEFIILSEVTQTQKENNCVLSFAYTDYSLSEHIYERE